MINTSSNLLSFFRSKSGSRKRDGGDRAGRSYPRPDANMDESSTVSDSVQTNGDIPVWLFAFAFVVVCYCFKCRLQQYFSCINIAILSYDITTNISTNNSTTTTSNIKNDDNDT